LSGTVDGINVNAHATDATIHYTETSINHSNILNSGSKTHTEIDNHINDVSLHYTVGSIDHNSISNLTTGDPHTQYIHKDGRAVSQLLHGSNQPSGTLTLKVLRPSSDSTLSKIIQLITQAQEARPQIQKFIDQYFTKRSCETNAIKETSATTEPVSPAKTSVFFITTSISKRWCLTITYANVKTNKTTNIQPNG